MGGGRAGWRKEEDHPRLDGLAGGGGGGALEQPMTGDEVEQVKVRETAVEIHPPKYVILCVQNT